MTLKTTSESEATGLTAEINDDDTRSVGYVTSHTKAMAINPAMTDAVTLEVPNHGFADSEIIDITLGATARNFLSRTLLALAVELDVPPTLSASSMVCLTPGGPRFSPSNGLLSALDLRKL
ncbi:hypothetical protein [Arthrobacter sp. 4R501]|uniref:hypothetical protein n=1 Tax=Arthrobacter sp. 4R501 TaxID=2058886 RepID=UPI0015E329D9|nr:hypothetical protein [Arthrobacter sp. 4R501]